MDWIGGEGERLEGRKYMVGKVGVHDDYKVPGRKLETVDVGGSESEFARAGFEKDLVGAVDVHQLFRDILGAVRGGVVDDDEFP